MKKNVGLHVLAVAFFTGAVFVSADSGAGNPDLSSYLRVERPDDHTYHLQTAMRRFVPVSGAGPGLWLVAVIHVGTPDYYAALQEFLDARDSVLYESVGGAPVLGDEDDRVSHSRQAVRFIRVLAERYRVYFGEYPASLDTLRRVVGKKRKDLTGRLKMCLTDGWGRDVGYAVAGGVPRVRSLGADGCDGGTGAAADIEGPGVVGADMVDQLAPRDDAPVYVLAGALGLKYQLASINYDRPHFVNSDVSMEWIRSKLKGNDAVKGLEALAGGSGWRGAFLRVALGILRVSPRAAAAVKLMMIEVFGGLKKMPRIDPETDRFMTVILEGRNDVVTADLERVCNRKDPPKSIAVFYGAAHMADLERHLTGVLKYRRDRHRWLRAFSMDTEKEGLDPATVRAVRWAVRSRLKKMQGGRDTED